MPVVDDAIPSVSPDGVHSWGLPPEPRKRPVLGLPSIAKTPPVLPAGYVEDLSSEIKVKSSGQASRVVLPGGALVTGNLDRSRMKTAAVYFSEAIDMLIRAFGPGQVSNTERFKLSMYRRREEFAVRASLLRASNAESLYDPISQAIEMPWIDAYDERWLGRILFHETVHAWMDISFGTTSPLWAAEGIAEYFSNFQFRGITEPGPVYFSVLYNLPDVPEPVDAFMRGGRDFFYGIDFQQRYAQAWSMIAFLMETDPDAVWALLNHKSIMMDEAAFRDFYGQLLKERVHA